MGWRVTKTVTCVTDLLAVPVERKKTVVVLVYMVAAPLEQEEKSVVALLLAHLGLLYQNYLKPQNCHSWLTSSPRINEYQWVRVYAIKVGV